MNLGLKYDGENGGKKSLEKCDILTHNILSSTQEIHVSKNAV